MSTLIGDIEQVYPGAAWTLREIGFVTDLDVQTLDRQDLHELFPGDYYLRQRRHIFNMIHKKKPIGVSLKSLTEDINECFRRALIANGVLEDYILILKDIKTQVTEVQTILDTHIHQLESNSKNQEEPESGSSSSVRNSATDDPPMFNSNQTDNNRPEERGYTTNRREETQGSWPQAGTTASASVSHRSWKETTQGIFSSVKNYFNNNKPDNLSPETQVEACSATVVQTPESQISGSQTNTPYFMDYEEVKYKKVVSGKTFGADQQVMDEVKSRMNVEAEFIENSEGDDITILFCPISSRVGSDADAALADVKDDNKVILVLMHHTHEPKPTALYKTWTHGKNVVMYTNVFYHETKHGLITCSQNTQAFTDIGKKLLEYSTTKKKICSHEGSAITKWW